VHRHDLVERFDDPILQHDACHCVIRITVARTRTSNNVATGPCRIKRAGSGEIVMPEQAAQQGRAAIQGGSRPSAGPRIPESHASSRWKVIGFGVAGALPMVAAIAGVVMMTGPTSPPSAVAPTSAVAPAIVPAPFEPAQATDALATNLAPPHSPVVPTPAPAVSDTTQSFARFAEPAPAPASNDVPGQCKIGQLQQLALNLSATQRKEIGNVIRIHSGSYVSPPIVLTPSIQTVTFPAPPGSTDSARIIMEQSNTNGGTFDAEANGITVEFEGSIDPHHDSVLLRWTTPRC
jgi:hypothetical protein